MTIWLRGFFGDRVEFIIIIDSYIHDMLYVLLVEWQYTYACVVSYDTFRIMIVTCSSLSRPGGLEIVFAHFCEFSGASGVSSSGTFCILLARKFLLGSSRIVKYDFVPLTSYGSFFISFWYLKCEKNFYFPSLPPFFFVRLIRGRCTLQSFTVLEQEFSLLGRDSPGMLCEFFVIHGDFTL